MTKARCRTLWLVMGGVLLAAASAHAAGVGASAATPWWVWPLAVFVACFLMGIVAVPAGIGGGTLFVPIIGSFFPFHLDFVRGAGLLVALASALSAAPVLLRWLVTRCSISINSSVVSLASLIPVFLP